MSLSEYNIEAAEFLSSGICPHDCRYCYIPKTDKMAMIHEEIIEDIKSGSIFDRLYELYGEGLRYMGFWGTEPTLTLPLIEEKLPCIFKLFPGIKQFNYSTAGITDQSIAFNFIKRANEMPIAEELEIDHQISIDGPPWITDLNRIEGACRIIEENVYKLIEMLNTLKMSPKLTVLIRWKSTVDVINMKQFIEDPTKLEEYYEFFIGIEKNIERINKQPNVKLQRGSFIPTLVMPGKYTSEQGRLFAQFLRMWHRGGMSSYTPRLERIMTFWNELPKRRQFSCSGGDSNFGLGKKLHMCHRSFYIDEDKYTESIMAEESSIGDPANWDISLFSHGIVDWMRKKFIIGIDQDVTRFLYTLRGHHDFYRFQIGYIRALVEELTRVGQADKMLIEDEGLFELFALFVLICKDCPMENLLNTGSINMVPVSMVRLWANGAFREVLNQCIRNLSKR